MPDSYGDLCKLSSLSYNFRAQVEKIYSPEMFEIYLINESSIPKLGYIDQNRKILVMAGIS